MKQEPSSIKLYGAQKLTIDEILKLETMKKKRYMATLTAKEKGEILMSGFISNLNNSDNHDRSF
ncbi:MAG: hypothetical protein K9G46_11845 [Flavobacteriales bacterium]|nr:hypothetical protein [Flavobacteriales bacterium]